MPDIRARINQQNEIIASKVEVNTAGINLGDLTDVTITSPTDGSYVIYQTSSNSFLDDQTIVKTGTGITLTGNLVATGDIDVDGTLEADAITVNGITLAETISDTVGAMVGSNTESGIAVTYDDSDNTLDFNVDDFSITLTGDVAGSGTVTNLGNVSFETTIQPDSVELNVDTTGQYIRSIVTGGGVGINISHSTDGDARITTLKSNWSNLPSYTLDRTLSSNQYVVMGLGTNGDSPFKSTLAAFQDETYSNVSGDITIAAGGAATIQATSVENSMLAGSITNAKLTNSSITVSDGTNTSPVALGGTLTFAGTSNEVTVVENAGTVTVGLPDDVTLGGDLVVTGDLTVNGTETILNSTTLSVDDKNIVLGSVTTPTDTTADGGGITLKGVTDKTLNWVNSTDSWTSSEHFEVASAKTFRINGNEVLSQTTLGSTVLASSLTIVGALDSGSITSNFSDIDIGDNVVTAAEFVGDLRGAVRFQAKAGESLAKGDVVYISSVSGQKPVVSKAQANSAATMPSFGLANAAVSANGNIEVISFGTFAHGDTTGGAEEWEFGDILYVSAATAGALTNVKPAGAANLIQNVGKVERVHASTGSIMVAGAGRTAATPNLDTGKFFIGDSNNYSTAGSFNNQFTNTSGTISLNGANITTVGTIGTGTWQGTAIANDYIGNHSAAKLTSGTIDNARLPSAATSITSVGTLTNLIIQPPVGNQGGVTLTSRGGSAVFSLAGVGSVGDAGYVAPGTFSVNDAATAVIISDAISLVGPTAVNGNFTVNNNFAEIVSTDAGTIERPVLSLYRNSGSPVDDDYIGGVRFFGNNNAGTPEKVFYGSISARAQTVTDGSNKGQIWFSLADGSGGTDGITDPSADIVGEESPVLKLTTSGLAVGAANHLSLTNAAAVDAQLNFNTNAGSDYVRITAPEATITAPRTVTFQDASGVFALTDSATAFTAGATTVNGALTVNSDLLKVVSTDDGAVENPILVLYRNSASIETSDELGAIEFRGNDANGEEHIYGRIYSEISVIGDDLEQANLNFVVSKAGGLEDPVMRLRQYALEMGPGNDIYLGAAGTLIFEGDSPASAHETTLYVENPTADRTILLPDAAGTIALTDSATAFTAGATTVNGALTVNSDLLEITSTVDDATEKPIISLYRDAGVPSANDELGAIRWFGQNVSDEKQFYGGIYAQADVITDGAHKGSLNFHLADGSNNGTAISDVLVDINGDEDPTMNLTAELLTLNAGLIVNNDSMEIVSTEAGADAMPIISLFKNGGSTTDGDDLGGIRFYGMNDHSTPKKTFYGGMYGELARGTNGDEIGRIKWHLADGSGTEDAVTDVTATITGDSDPTMTLEYFALNLKNDVNINFQAGGGTSYVAWDTGNNHTKLSADMNQDAAIVCTLPTVSGTLVAADDAGAITASQTISIVADTSIDATEFATYTGKKIVYTGAAGTVILADAVSGDLGKGWTIVNAGTGAITIDRATNSQTIKLLNGSSVSAGSANLTVATGGIIEITCTAADNYIAFGSGIS